MRELGLKDLALANPTYRTIQMPQWTEVVGELVQIVKGNPNNIISLIISTREGIYQLRYPVNSKEGQIIFNELSQNNVGDTIGIVQTDSIDTPLRIRMCH
ncbi:MAG: hypothetical protein KAS32_29945 [Candidatus Peribacteraceae bacterium]|nr:hypothetical protein [Candidatus Peribacteraceae bacterium]